MKRILLSFILLLLFTGISIAQPYLVKGYISDSLNFQPLRLASVVLIRTSDSVIQAHSRSGNDGSFELRVPRAGRYILHVSYPKFAEFEDVVNLHDFLTSYGTVQMQSSEHVLKEFVLRKNIAAIKIKGDTTEYVADSFKVKENATVEDLLKRLPGITVDKSGAITAQGETVQKVLVDGEEFFSDDPKVVTRGLQANAVDKVQVFDKKSDQTEFTGIDDGTRTKTINLELKEDKKKGVFGKVEAGGGSDGYFQNQGMINAFKGKRQISAFGIVSNTDKVGLDWADNNAFSTSAGITEINDEGQMTITSSNTSEDMAGWSGKFNGEGFPKIWTGGLHFANKWMHDTQHIAGNYRYALQNVEVNGSTTTQNPLTNDSEIVTRQNRNQFSRGERHALDGLYEWKLDSLTTLKVAVAGGQKTSDISAIYTSETKLQDSILANTNQKTSTSNGTSTFFNTDLLLRKKFMKKGRSLSVDMKENYKESESDGILRSEVDIYRGDTVALINRINQRKTGSTSTLAFSGKVTYTEPLSKIAFLEADYGLTVNNSLLKNLSYDSSRITRKLDSMNMLFSSGYKYNILINMAGAAARFVWEKYSFSVGGDVSNAAYVAVDEFRPDSSLTYSYLNFFPKANFTYRVGRATNFRLNYLGSTTQPTIAEIAPLRQNNDPLNVVVGNTALTQQFMNAFSVRFNNFKMLSGRFLFASASFNTINDAISTATTNINGLRTTKYVNVDGNYNGFIFFGYGYRLKKLDMQIGVHVNASLNHINSYVNDALNTTNNNSYTITPTLSYTKDKHYTIEFNPSITFSDNKSSITTSASFWQSNNELSVTVQLPWKMELNSEVNWFLRQQTSIFSKNNDVLLWNAYVSRKFTKKSNLECRLSALDILNQNLGYTRSSQAGIISENSYNTIRRYGMLSLIWNFTSAPGGAPQAPAGGMMMMRHR